MLHHRCEPALIALLFGDGPAPSPPSRSAPSVTLPGAAPALLPSRVPAFRKESTKDFKPVDHKPHPIDPDALGVKEWKRMTGRISARFYINFSGEYVAYQSNPNPQPPPPVHTHTVAKRSETGSGGVVFVKMPKGVAVLKSGTSLANEFFGAWVAEAVGVRAPKHRLLSHTNGEYEAVVAAVKRTASLETRIAMSRILQRANLAVLQFVRGKSLFEVSKLPSDAASVRQIGGIVALDIILNNFDRLPLIWSNLGNGDNVLVDKSGGVIALDNRVVVPTARGARDGHIAKIDRLARDIARSGKSAPQFERLATFFASRTHVGPLYPQQMTWIYEGFAATSRRIVAELTRDRLRQLKIRLASIATNKFWNTQVDPIDINFVCDAIAALSKAFPQPSGAQDACEKSGATDEKKIGRRDD